MIIEKIYAEAAPFLKERKIEAGIIGLTMAAVALDSGEIGTSLVLLEEIENRGEVKLEPAVIHGMSALEMAKWALEPDEHIIKRTLGMAALNASAGLQHFSADVNAASNEAIALRPTDTVGVIGYMRPLVKSLAEQVEEVIVYDNAEKEYVYAPETKDELLPTCDVVYITGTTLVNQTLDPILNICQNAREIMLVGPTTPMYPNAYRDSSISVIAGGIWRKECKDDIFRTVALNGGVPQLGNYFKKMALRINR